MDGQVHLNSKIAEQQRPPFHHEIFFNRKALHQHDPWYTRNHSAADLASRPLRVHIGRAVAALARSPAKSRSVADSEHVTAWTLTSTPTVPPAAPTRSNVRARGSELRVDALPASLSGCQLPVTQLAVRVDPPKPKPLQHAERIAPKTAAP